MNKKLGIIALGVLLLWAFGVALVGGIAVSGYLWYQSQQKVAYSGPCDPRIPFKTFTDSDWGYSISYPETWFIESYKPGERFGTGDPGAEYALVISNLEGNFGPDYSLGEEDYDQDTQVVRVFVYRGSKDPNQSVIEAEGGIDSLRDLPNFEEVTISGLNGFLSYDNPPSSDWVSYWMELGDGGYIISLDASIWGGFNYTACRDVAVDILQSFSTR